MKTGKYDIYMNKTESTFITSRWPVVFIVIVAVGLFANTFGYGFIYDDQYMIVENWWLRDISNIGEIFSSSMWGFKLGSESNYYRPVAHMVFMSEFKLFGLSGTGYHVVNSLLHALSALLVFFITRRLLFETEGVKPDNFTPSLTPDNMTNDKSQLRQKANSIAFFAALLFAVHPVHVEVVAMASAVAELSVSLTYLASLYFYIRHRDGGGGVSLLFSVLIFAIALFLKETGVTVLAVIGAYDFFIKNRLSIRETLRPGALLRYLPFLVAFLIYMVIRMRVMGGVVPLEQEAGLSFFGYILNDFPHLASYIRLLFLPVDLNVFYSFHPVYSPFEPRALIGIIVVLVSAGLVFYFGRRQRTILFGAALLILALAPALYLPAVGVRGNNFAERYLYIPSAGFSIIIAFIFYRLVSMRPAARRYIGIFIITLVITLFGIKTISRNMVWSHPYLLWKDAASKTFDSDVVYVNLGGAADSKGLTEEALAAYGKALVLNPASVEAHNNIGSIYFKAARYDLALEYYQKARDLTSNPRSLSIVYEQIGNVYFTKERHDKAIENYKSSIATGRTSAGIFNKLGITYGKQGSFLKAKKSFEEALAINPDHVGAKRNLEEVKRAIGR